MKTVSQHSHFRLYRRRFTTAFADGASVMQARIKQRRAPKAP